MVANGLASGRSSFYDLVHPTHSREATEQAHAAIGSSSSGGSSGVPPPGTLPPGAGSAAAAVAAAAAAGGGAATPRQATQPMAITGVSRVKECACLLIVTGLVFQLVV